MTAAVRRQWIMVASAANAINDCIDDILVFSGCVWRVWPGLGVDEVDSGGMFSASIREEYLESFSQYF